MIPRFKLKTSTIKTAISAGTIFRSFITARYGCAEIVSVQNRTCVCRRLDHSRRGALSSPAPVAAPTPQNAVASQTEHTQAVDASQQEVSIAEAARRNKAAKEAANATGESTSPGGAATVGPLSGSRGRVLEDFGERPYHRPCTPWGQGTCARRSRCLWLILIAIHFDRPKQMRERELGELPLADFLDINLSHHKRIGDFVLTDYCLQINVL